jgi:DNA-binding NtrC family response regulator
VKIAIPMSMNPDIWTLVSGEESSLLLADLAESQGLKLTKFENVAEAVSRREPEDGVILAIEPGKRHSNYHAVIRRFRKRFFALDAIVFGPLKSVEERRRETQFGVDLYVAMPAERDDFLARAEHLVALRRLRQSAGIIGRSEPLMDMLDMVLQVAPTEVSVLLEGESGSGKELTARAIHMTSRRAYKPFEAVNCGSLAESLLESELFGHERGSFTGAVSRRVGLFERADKGTLFLDEVGEMSLNMQVKLLRVIETGEFLRVGGAEKNRTDVRLIAATNRELESAVERGEFRRDLYYRLKVVQIRIPTLRSRSVDIPILVNYFIERSGRKHGKEIRSIDKEGLELLVNYPWPGNVRELANMIDNLVVLSKDVTIRREDIEKRLQGRLDGRTFTDLPVPLEKTRDDMERELIINSLLSLNNDVKEILRLLRGGGIHDTDRWGRYVEVEEAPLEETKDLNRIEREAIKAALVANGGNRRRTAKQLGISERTLYRRLKEYNLT